MKNATVLLMVLCTFHVAVSLYDGKLSDSPFYIYSFWKLNFVFFVQGYYLMGISSKDQKNQK